MKKVILSVSTLTFLVLAIYSCSKDEVLVKDEKKALIQNESLEKKKVDPFDSDSVGYFHNFYLNEIKNFAIDSNITFDKFSLNQHVTNNIKYTGVDNSSEFDKYQTLGFVDYFQNMKNQNLISENVNQELSLFYQDFILGKNQNELKLIAFDLYNRAQSDSKLTTQEKDLLQKAASIAYHSVDFWFTNMQSYEKANCGVGCKIAVALADVAGGVLGFVGTVGSPLGAVAGGAFFSILARCCAISSCEWASC